MPPRLPGAASGPGRAWALAWRPPAAPGRGRRRTAAAACASPPGARRSRSANTSASRWVIAAAFCFRSPSAGTGISAMQMHPPAVVGEPEDDREQRRAGLHGQRRRARASSAPSRRRSPTSMPLPVTSRSAGRQTARRPAAAGPARRTGWPRRWRGSTSMPSPSRYATNRSYSDSGLSRSTTVVNEPAPRAMIQAPAWSQLPMCGSARITPRPASRSPSVVSISPSSCMPLTSRSTGITGQPEDLHQYRTYDRIASRDTARSSCRPRPGRAPGAGWPPASAPAGPAAARPRRRRSRNTAAAHRSGSRRTTDQPSW